MSISKNMAYKVNNKSQPKALLFYQYLPPWRIDVFNKMAEYYDLIIVFFNANCEGFTYNRAELVEKLHNIKVIFWDKGFNVGSRPIRFGIYSLIKKERPDVIFAHEYSLISAEIALIKKTGLVKFRYYLTTSDNLMMAETSSGMKQKSRDFVLNNADGCIVYSKSVLDFYHKEYPDLKLDICPNIQSPLSLLKYREQFPEITKNYLQKYKLDGKKTILYSGRLVHVKGLDLLLTAFATLKTDEWYLVLVGNGEKETELKLQCKALGVEDNVVFPGYCSGANLYAWYDIANFFILPSRYEPFGAVVNEALVYGCPVVASKYIGALDFIDETNGIVFDPLNKSEFEDTLSKAIKKYSEPVSAPRENKMTREFDYYVECFKTINE